MSIGLYNDSLAQLPEVMVAVKKLSCAFKNENAEFWNLLTERIVANSFTSERLKDAINHVLDNFQYKELNISDIVKFDKRKKLYTNEDVYRLTGRFPSPEYEKIEINGKWFCTKITDI